MTLKFVDAHVHGFPDKLFDAIWDYFIHNYWNINYKLYSEDVVKFIQKQGAKYLNILNYGHKPGISRDLNNWSYDFGKNKESVLSFGTIHPEDSYYEEELERILSPNGLDLKGIKLQILVTDFDPEIQKLDLMYETLIEYDKILVMHAGTGPGANEHVGIQHVKPVMERFPKLKLQIPHMGSYEYSEFFDLCRNYPNVYLDTAMIFIDHKLFYDKFDENTTFDDLLDIQDRIMFGSDFPNIPYDYSKSIESIINLPVPEDVKSKIFYKNAINFYNLKSFD